MNLDRLHNLLLIAEKGSMTSAATALYISPVSLREQLNHLEEELGFPIFERSNQGVIPTPAGDLFLQEIRPMLTEMDHLIDRCRSIAAPSAKTLHIGVYAPYNLNQYCSSYLKSHPEMTFTYGESNYEFSSNSLQVMESAGYDLMQECYSPEFTAQGLSFLPLHAEPYCCFLSPSHSLHGSPCISLSSLRHKNVYSTLALSLDVRLLAKRCREFGVALRQVPDDDFNFLRICTAGDIYIAEQGLSKVFSQFECIPIEPIIPLVHGVVYRNSPPPALLDFLHYIVSEVSLEQIQYLRSLCNESCEALHLPSPHWDDLSLL